MDLLNQRILYRDRYWQYKENGLPYNPVRFAFPMIAYHVRINTIETKLNFIQETILLLKKNGMSKAGIADCLCLDSKLVDIIIKNNEKDAMDGDDSGYSIKERNIGTTDFFIFYDLITEQFIDGYMEVAVFNEILSKITPEGFSEKEKIYYLRENIGKSKSKRIHLITKPGINFDILLEPSQEDIVECYKKEAVFSSKKYENPEYLGERYPVWLTLDYSVTPYNKNEFAIVNPFREGIAFSTYFTNLIKKLAVDEYSIADLEEYYEDISSGEIHKQNRRMNINSASDTDAYKRLQKKYEGCEFFISGNFDKFVSQIVKMQSKYDRIEKEYGKKDCSETAREFYVFANNVLEELFISTYAPYVSVLYERLNKDGFFEKINKEYSDKNKKAIIEKYVSDVETVNDISTIMECISPDNIVKTLRSRNISSEKSYKPGLKELFIINVICSYYFNDCKFKRLLNTKIEYLSEAIGVILAERQQASHTLLKPDEYVTDAIGIVYQIIDIIMDVSNSNAIEKADENLESIENYLASYTVVNDMTLILKESSNRLLLDIYNASELYFSDCVTAFENISKVIVDYVMRNISSIEQLEDYLSLLPNDQDEAKIMLMDCLDELNVESDFDRITVNVKKAKKCLLRGVDIRPASTMIFFAPLLLAKVDFMAFMSLFERLGSDYFSDAIMSINNRGHNNLSVNWDQIKIINDRYLEYCRIMTLFDREEL